MHQGFFERANGGTLFLDEVTEMPPDLQVKLLRVLETGRFMRVGSTQSQESDVRVIAATNRVPEQAVAAGKLREDLMYRLNVFPIELPPLRERLGDIPLLAEHFLAEIGRQEGRKKRLDARALERLQRHSWPGNVRELRNAIQRAYVMAAGETIDEQWLPGVQPTAAHPVAAPAPAAAPRAAAADPADRRATSAAAEHLTVPIGTSMAEAEKALILATYRHFGQHKERAAAVLGISLKTLYNRLKEYQSEGEPPTPPR
jgi:DNA-binding NtrC family response regulator